MHSNFCEIGPDHDTTKYRSPYCTEHCLKNLNDGKLQCNCGVIGIYEWLFVNKNNNNNNNNYNIDNRNNDNNITTNNVLITTTQEIIFHPVYSSGTAVLRGEQTFQENQHHYWEMKILSKLYGTDVMVGIGTADTMLQDSHYRFYSLLGFDNSSWGYSYHGSIQHCMLKTKYGFKYGMGSLVGVYLDMCNGTVEFYFNRKPLGVAFNGLKSLKLHPMVCSTAAQSSMKMTCSTSVDNSLQLLCLKTIIKYPLIYKQLKNITALIRIYKKKYFWLITDDEIRRKQDTDVINNREKNPSWKKRKVSSSSSSS